MAKKRRSSPQAARPARLLPVYDAPLAAGLPSLVEVWMTILPAHFCGIDPCDGGTESRCKAPTTYALCGQYAGAEGLINSWYYCPPHAQARAARAGLPWPPTRRWDED